LGGREKGWGRERWRKTAGYWLLFTWGPLGGTARIEKETKDTKAKETF